MEIIKIEFIESTPLLGKEEIYEIDAVDNIVRYFYNGKQQKEELKDITEFVDRLSNYILYWNKEYVNAKAIDGKSSSLEISISDGSNLNYTFNNKYPYNYSDFLKDLKKIVGDIR